MRRKHSWFFIIAVLGTWVLLCLPRAALALTQNVGFEPEQTTILSGTISSLEAWYDIDDGSPTTGIGVRVHFNSTLLQFSGFRNVYGSSLMGQDDAPQPDTSDFDADSGTDQFVLIAWFDISGNWPGDPLSTKLFDIDFKGLQGGTAPVNISFSSIAAGYSGLATNASFTVLPDVDGDGMEDGWETDNFGDLSHNGSADSDGDGLTDLQEYENDTDPNLSDSDSDGMADGWEVSYSLDPKTDDAGLDPDHDDFTNGREFQDDTDPGDLESHLVLPGMTGRVPDTGQVISYTDTFGEDADYRINTPFFIKVDNQGRFLADTAVAWEAVYDAVSGLYWEVKKARDGSTDYANPRDGDNTYTWYDPNPETNGGDEGTPGTATDTQDVVDYLNSGSFIGFSDWRLPTVQELLSLADFSTSDPAMQTEFFPNIGSSNWYWSSTSSGNKAWTLIITDGSLDFSLFSEKSDSHYVMAVCGNRIPPEPRFIDNGDGTVTDVDTGLMWEQAGQAPGTWEAALAACESLTLAGYADWRLPTVKELQTLVDYDSYLPAIDDTLFSAVDFTETWSSTAYVSFDTRWLVDFTDGDVWYDSEGNSHPFRAVRGGQNEVAGNLYITSPLQGSFWVPGDTMPITWDTAGLGGDVSILLSTDGGLTFGDTVAASTPNDGSFDWTVMVEGGSVNCVIRIEPIGQASKGTLQGLFTINTPPNVPANPNPPSGEVDIRTSAELL